MSDDALPEEWLAEKVAALVGLSWLKHGIRPDGYLPFNSFARPEGVSRQEIDFRAFMLGGCGVMIVGPVKSPANKSLFGIKGEEVYFIGRLLRYRSDKYGTIVNWFTEGTVYFFEDIAGLLDVLRLQMSSLTGGYEKCHRCGDVHHDGCLSDQGSGLVNIPGQAWRMRAPFFGPRGVSLSVNMGILRAKGSCTVATGYHRVHGDQFVAAPTGLPFKVDGDRTLFGDLTTIRNLVKRLAVTNGAVQRLSDFKRRVDTEGLTHAERVAGSVFAVYGDDLPKAAKPDPIRDMVEGSYLFL